MQKKKKKQQQQNKAAVSCQQQIKNKQKKKVMHVCWGRRERERETQRGERWHSPGIALLIGGTHIHTHIQQRWSRLQQQQQRYKTHYDDCGPPQWSSSEANKKRKANAVTHMCSHTHTQEKKKNKKKKTRNTQARRRIQLTVSCNAPATSSWNDLFFFPRLLLFFFSSSPFVIRGYQMQERELC